MRLTAFEASNFKSIGPHGARIEFAPVTVLVGENGAGKTSLLEALAFVGQRARSLGKFSLEGEFVKFGSHDDYVFGTDKAAQVRTVATFSVQKSELEGYTQLHDEMQRGARSWSADVDRLGLKEKPTRGLSKDQVGDMLAGIQLRSSSLASGNEPIMAEFTIDSGGQRRTASVTVGSSGVLWRADNRGAADGRLFIAGEHEPYQYAVNHAEVIEPLMDKHFSYAEQGPPFTLAAAVEGRGTRVIDQGNFPNELRTKLRLYRLLEDGIVDALQRIYYLSAPRGRLSSLVPAGETMDWVGHSAEDLARFLTNLQGDPSKKDVADVVRHWAKEFGIDSLNAASRGRPELHLDYVDEKLKVSLGAQGLGYGSSQILPIIAQGFAAPPGSVLLIEEPEISLHPNAQIKLMDMIAEMVKQDKRLVLTTHSATVLMGLGRLLRKPNELKAADIRVYEVTKQESGSDVRKLRVNEHGYVEGWVDSFGHATRQLLDAYVESVPMHEKD